MTFDGRGVNETRPAVDGDLRSAGLRDPLPRLLREKATKGSASAMEITLLFGDGVTE